MTARGSDARGRFGRDGVVAIAAALVAGLLAGWFLGWAAGWAVGATLLAAGAALLLRRARREATRALEAAARQTDARTAEIRTLDGLLREIWSTRDPAVIVRAVERDLRKLLPVDRFVAAAVEADPGRLQLVRPWTQPRPGFHAVDEEFLRTVGFGRRPIQLDETGAMTVPLSEPGASADQAPVRSALACPMVVQDRVIGVLALGSLEPRAYTPADLELLATVAQAAAGALEHARRVEASRVDALTGLLLRDDFFRRLEEEHHRAARYASPFAVLMLDVDGFKQINDRLGHLAGDRYLQELGADVRATLRSADLACRFGGDELCILLPQTDAAGAAVIAERLRAGVSELVVDIDGEPVRTTVSIGLAVYPQHGGGQLKGLVRAADEALYRAKRTGRDRVVSPAA